MIRNNIFTILISVIILYLSFANSSSFQGTIITDIPFLDKILKLPYIDKIVHISLYFLLMLVIIIEHRQKLPTTRILVIVGLLPVIFGSLIELLQSDLTSTRQADIFDIASNSIGVVCALLLWILIKPYKLEKVR
jgi:VanZ family protein